MGKVAEAVGGAALIAGAIWLDFASAGAFAAVNPLIFSMVLSGGASLLLGGAAGLIAGTPQSGVTVAGADPIGVWGYAYGTVKVGGTVIFTATNSSQGTSNNKEYHRVIVLACHPCNITQSTVSLRLDGQILSTNYDGVLNQGQAFVSSSPIQAGNGIASISRAGGLVTVNLKAPLVAIQPDGTALYPQLQSGQNVLVTGVNDNTFNGTFLAVQTTPTQLTYICGGTDGSSGVSSSASVVTTLPDYSNKVYYEVQDGTQTETFYGALTSGLAWNSNCLCTGKTVMYLRMGYDQATFPSGSPKVSVVLQGKNDILDPRTGTRGYTTNAALCIADFLCLPTDKGGFGMSIGTNLPGLYVDEAQLIAAANICDEPVNLAAGGTQPRYTINGYLPLSVTRGSIVAAMLSACAGRLTREGGAYKIFPGAWVSSTFSATIADMRGPIKLSPLMSARDICNGVKGTYISADNNYQQADFPPYAQDTLHGYGPTDANQAFDGGDRIWLDVQLQCTSDSAMAQRLAKIELMRRRHQGRYTVRLSMRAYSVIAMDVIDLTVPRYNWVAKLFEVLNSRIVIERQDGNGAPVLCMELDLAETDPTVYDWFTTEELASQGYVSPSQSDTRVCPYPEQLLLYSGPGATINGVVCPDTVTTTASGLAINSLWVNWLAPNDGYVLNGGQIEVQYQIGGTGGGWLAFAAFNPSVTSCFIPNLSDGQQVYVRIRAVNCAGTPSDWVVAGPETISSTLSVLAYSGVQVAPDGTLTGIANPDGTASIEVMPFTATVASQTSSCAPNPVYLNGLTQGAVYDVYYVDPYFAGGTITPVATLDPADYIDKAGHFLIGTATTPAVAAVTGSVRKYPSTWSDTGARSTTNPGDACSGSSPAAIVSGACIDYTGPTYSNGACTWLGFPAGSTSYDRKLYITVSTATSTTAISGGGGGSGGGSDPPPGATE